MEAKFHSDVVGIDKTECQYSVRFGTDWDFCEYLLDLRIAVAIDVSYRCPRCVPLHTSFECFKVLRVFLTEHIFIKRVFECECTQRRASDYTRCTSNPAVASARVKFYVYSPASLCFHS